MIRTLTILVLLCLTCGQSVGDVTDTPEMRRREAERYVKAINPREVLNDFFEKATQQLPRLEREKRRARLALIDIDAFTKAMVDILVKHMTTAELKALADFYGSPVGKSAMKKWGDCFIELAPVIRTEAEKAEKKFDQIGSQ